MVIAIKTFLQPLGFDLYGNGCVAKNFLQIDLPVNPHRGPVHTTLISYD
jgi:hypothetical protein